MKSFYKYFLIGGILISGMFLLVPDSHAWHEKPEALLHPSEEANGTQVLAVDTPPVNNSDLHYPIDENGYGEPIYNPQHPLELNNPSNITQSTEYDPLSKEYIFQQKIGDYNYRPPIGMSEEDFQDYLFRKQVKDYFKSRISADDINKGSTSLIPPIKVGGETFDRIFGGNTVDIRPNGSAELSFGLITNKTQNPAIPVKQRKITNFDFNMKVQLNLVGKIGEKLKLTTNYNTEASFDFENQMKIEYNGLEDEILKSIEMGNVNLPLNSSLITGSQSLFGIKTKMQFGRLTATTVLSQQRGKKTEVTVQGGSQTSAFSVNGDNYEANRHYFLSHYFRDNYNNWMSTIPLISSPIVITKIEVWVTNRTTQVDQARNIVSFADLGEDINKVVPNLTYDPLVNGCGAVSAQYRIADSSGLIPANGANSLYHMMTNETYGLLKDRDYSNASSVLRSNNSALNNTCNTSNQFMESGRDFEVVFRARKLQPSEYKINSRLGYVSLNQSLNYDEVLSVAFQYTYNGKTYQVGEFSDQFPNGDQPLYLKLLKSTLVNTKVPMWDLMMKNVYSIGAYQVNAQDFNLQVFRNTKGIDLPYIDYETNGLKSTPLLQVMDLDRINVNQDKIPDGYYDFIEGVTILASNGRIFLPKVEPFGNDLRPKFGSDSINPAINDFIYQELYDSTKIIAQQLTKKNVYRIKGTYKSSSSSEISLNSMNVPQGSVTVTAGGVPLTENVDYTVDYTLGRVKIINESILNSGQPIKVSSENNSLFMIQQKSLIGTRLDFKINKDFTVGGTFLRLTERPLTQKVNIGDEPVSNIIWGSDFNYRTEAPWLTRLVDKIPLINTKEMSSIQTAGEFAQLVPGSAKAIRTTDKGGTSYIDDFEGSVSQIDLRNQGAWYLSGVPQGQNDLFPEASLDSIYSGFNRAKMAWYTVDQSVFYLDNGITPGNITKTIKSNNFMRAIVETEIFPNKQPPNGQPVLLPVLDLALYPGERGPYNYDVTPTAFSSGIDFASSNGANGVRLNNPKSRWGGIMRRMDNTDFQTANVEFIQFWMMDPFNEDYEATFPGQSKPQEGELYINIGNVSEDILKDGKMAFENGMPKDGDLNTAVSNSTIEETAWGYVPKTPIIVQAFDVNEGSRPYQDVGYDGLKDEEERNAFATNYLNLINAQSNGAGAYAAANLDPSADNYNFYRDDDFDANASATTVYRYKWYNNPEGNSPTESQYNNLNPNGGNYPTTATTIPNAEDINRDNTLSETEAYYQYKIKITPQDLTSSNVGNNYITNVFEAPFTDANGNARTVKWFQFKVPIVSFEKKVGAIEGFNSIRFMRVFMKNFSAPVICRMARMELVRSDWRRYDGVGADPGDYLGGDEPGTSFEISAVNVQENGNRTPINYILPPGISQQQNVQTTNLVLLNEQALVLRTIGLKDGFAKAANKNIDFDLRSFKKMKMFVHAEQIGNNPLADGETHLFVRIGTDFISNYYEYEIPLKVTPVGNYDGESERDKVWPTENDMTIDFDQMVDLKKLREFGSIETIEKAIEGGKIIRMVGNPSISNIKTIMVGIRNPKDVNGDPKSVEVWINELRLTDFDNKGGWAANARVTAKLADFAQVAFSGAYTGPYFGSIEKKVSERSRDQIVQYDASSTVQLGKFFPDDWKLNIPFYINRAQITSTPMFDASNPDFRMDEIDQIKNITAAQMDKIRDRSRDITTRRGFNFTNISKQRGKNKTKVYPWDIENFNFTYAFNEQIRRNITVDHNTTRSYRAALGYNYQVTPKNIKPFAKTKVKWLNNKWFAIIKDFNFYPLPSRFSFNTDVLRNYNELQNRVIANDQEYDQALLFNKTFFMNRIYDLKWDFSKSLKFDFNANNDGRILEPQGAIDTKEEKEIIKQNLLNLGVNTGYRHATNISYTLPINKIPLLDFITTTYSYKANYQWTRRPFAADSLGNVIQNGNSHNINAQLNMNNLYNKIPYFKKVNTGGTKGGNKGKDIKKSPTDTSKKEEKNYVLLEHIARFIMMLKQVQVTFDLGKGTTLPGYVDSTRLFGMNTQTPGLAPGLGFVFGQQEDNFAFVDRAEKNNWLIKRNNLAQAFAQTNKQSLNYSAKIEPFKDLRIDLTGTRTYGENNGFYINYVDSTDSYNRNTFTRTGNFSISIISIGSAFTKDDKETYANATFDKFRNIRSEFQNRLWKENQFSDKGLENDGYDATQQDVILYSFIAAYTNKSTTGTKLDLFQKIPLPNWSVTYDGLGKIEALKKLFKSVTLRHTYRSSYSMGSFSNNLLFTGNVEDYFSDARLNGSNSNFVSKYQINTVTISESFAPLAKVDMQFTDKGKFKNFKTSFEMKKDRTVSLNSNIPQVTETRGNEMIVGVGYRYPELELKKIKIKGKPVKSNLDIRADLSIRKSATIQRRVIDGLSIPSQGQNVITLKISADYALGQNINLRFYFDKIINRPVVSTSFPTSNANSGISLRFNLVQ